MATPNLNALAHKALELIADGMVVGLGSGRASTAFIEELGRRVQDGSLRVRGVPTSQASADVAMKFGIPLVTLEDVEAIDVTIDGADEVDPAGNCVKGYGGALVREKIVAAASQKLVIVIGAEKLVDQLGQRGKLPVEVLPFARGFCDRKLAELGLTPQLREKDGRSYVTDNGNHILDCALQPLDDPAALESALRGIPGVVGTGLFLGMADTILIDRQASVEVRNL
jgi:ribose 5-phosphate isomerase A